MFGSTGRSDAQCDSVPAGLQACEISTTLNSAFLVPHSSTMPFRSHAFAQERASRAPINAITNLLHLKSTEGSEVQLMCLGAVKSVQLDASQAWGGLSMNTCN